MTIDALPQAPSENDPPAVFSALATEFVAALDPLVSQVNEATLAMNLNATNSTSTSSVAIGVGAKTFTVQADKSYLGGMYVVIADAANSATNNMLAIVDDYDIVTGQLDVVVQSVNGSGTISDWKISQNPVVVPGIDTYYVSTVGGTANAITLSPSPAVTAYVPGQKFIFTATNAGNQTGNGTTVNISGLGAITLSQTSGFTLGSRTIVLGFTYEVTIISPTLATIKAYDGLSGVAGRSANHMVVSYAQPTFPSMSGLSHNNIFMTNSNTSYALTTGTGNICIGTSSGSAITTGQNNLVIANNDPTGLTTNSSNIAIGQSNFNFTGLSNAVALGTTVGYLNYQDSTGWTFAGSGSKALTVPSGLSFPATASLQADANTLDDYEEGSWTPSVGGTATYTAQVGRYVKIGKTVFIKGVLTINAIGTGSTTVISGLPFTSENLTNGDASISVSEWTTAAASFLFVAGKIGANVSTITLENLAAAAASTGTSAFFTSSTSITFSGFYQTSL
jgi:hypothetical protein